MPESVGNLLQLIEALPDCPDAQRKIIHANIKIAIEQGLKNRRLSILMPELPEPVRRLSADEEAEICEVGRRHSWEVRKEDDKRSSMQWVLDYYNGWIPGLLKQHIKRADPKLYLSFIKGVGRRGFPQGVDIPAAWENAAREAAHNASEREWIAWILRRQNSEHARKLRRPTAREELRSS